uniref:LRAT domain-containing protein n=1 Tax=Neolamprologus brichardi TaxID=32507 RepID=A0A3Q4GFX2_NEOBR
VLPQRGDLIEIFRDSYQHWAVYVGDGSVVHLVVPSKSRTHFPQLNSSQGAVREETLRAVVGNDQWQINNSLDSTYRPRPADVIVTEARSWVGRTITYHSIRRNCEHFATEQRYGVSASQQVGGQNLSEYKTYKKKNLQLTSIHPFAYPFQGRGGRWSLSQLS